MIYSYFASVELLKSWYKNASLQKLIFINT